MSGRLDAVRGWMADEELDALIVSRASNVRYLTGFSGEGLLVIDDAGEAICTDSRYDVQARDEAPGTEVVADGGHLRQVIDRLQAAGPARVGFEAEHVTYATHQQLTEALEGVDLCPCEDEIVRLRAVKDEGELTLIERAATVADEAFGRWWRWVEPGVSEREAALELEREMVLGGAEGASFDIIVASGPNGARPHATPGERRIATGELVVVDWGAVVEGYCSDCTRTVILGEPDARQREVWDAVRAAQQAAIDALEPGMAGGELDGMAREVLRERELDEYFGHGLGHGVGLDVHERPRLGRSSEDVLRAGMVVTVEPGVYIEGWGGVRLEELVAVTEGGARTLTRALCDL